MSYQSPLSYPTSTCQKRPSLREPELTIVGEEVKSSEGDIIGLFITATVPSGGTPEEVCQQIRAMGGLLFLIGALIMAYNLVRTVHGERRQEAAVLVPAAA